MTVWARCAACCCSREATRRGERAAVGVAPVSLEPVSGGDGLAIYLAHRLMFRRWQIRSHPRKSEHVSMLNSETEGPGDDRPKEGGAHDAKEAGRGGGDQAADQGSAAARDERQDPASAGDPEEQLGEPGGQAAGVPDAQRPAVAFPRQTPLFHAQHAERYARQELIRAYEQAFGCRLIVVIDAIFGYGVTFLEELLVGANRDQDLHLLLDSPGGDGETAIRLVRSAQSRCRELTVIVPNQAKSAGTILVMGAHRILMGPTSDLGPVDPQFRHPTNPGLYSAKDLIAAVEAADAAIAANPESYPLHASLLADVTAIMVQQARSALERTDDLVREALSSRPGRSSDDVDWIAAALKEKLVDLPQNHGAVFNAADAHAAGLPVEEVDPDSEQWRIVWQLWTKYFQLLPASIYEGELASQIIDRRGQ